MAVQTNFSGEEVPDAAALQVQLAQLAGRHRDPQAPAHRLDKPLEPTGVVGDHRHGRWRIEQRERVSQRDGAAQRAAQ